jgi:hypothetical protein
MRQGRQNLILTTRPERRNEVPPPSCRRRCGKRGERWPGPTSGQRRLGGLGASACWLRRRQNDSREGAFKSCNSLYSAYLVLIIIVALFFMLYISAICHAIIWWKYSIFYLPKYKGENGMHQTKKPENTGGKTGTTITLATSSRVSSPSSLSNSEIIVSMNVRNLPVVQI